jgi:phage-related minor tail protein
MESIFAGISNERPKAMGPMVFLKKVDAVAEAEAMAEAARLKKEKEDKAKADAKEAAKEAQRVKDAQKLARDIARATTPTGDLSETVAGFEGDRLVAEREERARAADVALGMQNAMNESLAQTTAEIKAGTEAFVEQQGEIVKNQSYISEFQDTVTDMAYVLDNSFVDLFTGATHSAKEFFAEILKGFAMIFAQKAAMKATDSLLGLLPGFAKGGAFSHGQLIPFASGGVVGGPTTFAMAGGRTGMMGEAGAEAIMPLRRSKSGALGVVGATPQVHLHNNTGVQMDARVSASNERLSIVLEAAQMGASMAEEKITRSMRSGYGSTATSLQGTYGLRRRV